MVQSAKQAFIGLVRQTVHQVKIDQPDTACLQRCHTGFDHLDRLDAANGGLNFRIETLHAKANPADLRHRERHGPFEAEGARIDFDGNIGIIPCKHRHQPVNQPDEGNRFDGIGAAPAKGNPLQLAAAAQHLCDQRHLCLKCFKICVQPVRPPGRTRVATAIPADRLAIRDMRI